MTPRVTPELQLEIERFLFEEAALLDRHEYRDWVSLFTEDLVYRMPVTTNYHEQAVGAPPPPGPQAYYFHDALRTPTQRVKVSASGHDLLSDALFPARLGFTGTPNDLVPLSLTPVHFEPASEAARGFRRHKCYVSA